MKNDTDLLELENPVFLGKNELLERAVEKFKNEWNEKGNDDWIVVEDSRYANENLLVVVFSREHYIGKAEFAYSMLYTFEENPGYKVHYCQIYYEEYYRTIPLKTDRDKFIIEIASVEELDGHILIKTKTDTKDEKEFKFVY